MDDANDTGPSGPPVPAASLDPADVTKRFDAAMRKLARAPADPPEEAAPGGPSQDEPPRDTP